MAESIKRINVPEIPKGGPYTQGVVHGDTMYLSGVVGVAAGQDKSFEEQWNTITGRISTLLKGMGSELENGVIKTTVYLSGPEYFKELNSLFSSTFPDSAPARTTIVCEFTLAEVKVEVDVIAAKL